MAFAKFGWNLPSGSGEENENVKSLQQWQQRQKLTAQSQLSVNIIDNTCFKKSSLIDKSYFTNVLYIPRLSICTNEDMWSGQRINFSMRLITILHTPPKP